jgi:hypothetical protein
VGVPCLTVGVGAEPGTVEIVTHFNKIPANKKLDFAQHPKNGLGCVPNTILSLTQYERTLSYGRTGTGTGTVTTTVTPSEQRARGTGLYQLQLRVATFRMKDDFEGRGREVGKKV